MSDTFEENDLGPVDLSSVEDSGGFEVIPKATYPVFVHDAEAKKSNNSGNPMISLQLEIEEGDFAGRRLFTHITFSPKAMSMAKASLRALGQGETIDAGPFDITEMAAALVGARARAKVSIEKYDGEDTNRVKGLLPAGEAGDGFLD